LLTKLLTPRLVLGVSDEVSEILHNSLRSSAVAGNMIMTSETRRFRVARSGN